MLTDYLFLRRQTKTDAFCWEIYYQRSLLWPNPKQFRNLRIDEKILTQTNNIASCTEQKVLRSRVENVSTGSQNGVDQKSSFERFSSEMYLLKAFRYSSPTSLCVESSVFISRCVIQKGSDDFSEMMCKMSRKWSCTFRPPRIVQISEGCILWWSRTFAGHLHYLLFAPRWLWPVFYSQK